MKRGLHMIWVYALALFFGGCTDVGYYAQGVIGHMDLMRRVEPIEQVLARPDTPRELTEKLREVVRIRDYASRELHLPENASYRTFADLERPYVVWNLVAAPELDIRAKTWCFPVAGCVSYRGYFSEERARRQKEVLQAQGFDVYLYGVSAYSTLNWFDDPMLNTMLSRSRVQMAALIFHELSHQVTYVPGDSPFNEAFAKTVELEGVRRYLLSMGEQEEYERFLLQKERERQFIDLVLSTRSQLQALYDGPLDPEEKRRQKELVFGQLRQRYAELKGAWGGYAGYDRWFESDLNNAKLASISTYNLYLPAFETLLVEENNDLRRFYARVREYAELSPPERRARLDALLKRAPVRVARTPGE